MAVYEQYAIVIAKAYPNGVGRLRMAEEFGVTKGTAIVHLEKCVRKQLLIKVYTWISRSRRGWVYFSPDNPPQELPF